MLDSIEVFIIAISVDFAILVLQGEGMVLHSALETLKGNSMKNVALVEARANAKALRESLKAARENVKALREAAKVEAAAAKAEKAARKVAKVAELKAKRKARIAALEAKLAALKAKASTPKARKRANRKASKVTVIVANGEAVAS